jgi:hypothetical protein
MTSTLQIKPFRFALILTLIALALAVISWAVVAYEWSLGVFNTYWVVEASSLFNVTFEGNVPTWYTTLLMLIAALLSLFIAAHAVRQRLPWRIHWVGLMLLFLYLSLDEAAAIHEIFTSPTREAFNTSGYLHFSWILVGIPVAIGIALLFLPFVLNLPAKTRAAFLIAGVVYLLGAVGVELIGANMWYETDGLVTPQYTAVGGVEEFLEMFGVILAIYGLLVYLDTQIDTITIQFGAAKKEDDNVPSS